MKGMILAAGLGTRLRPLTEKRPKALIKVGDYMMLDLAIAYFIKHGIRDIIINVNHFADQIMEYVAQKRWEGFNLEISDETSGLLNTGGGMKKASWFFEGEENFVLMAVDILTDLDLTAMVNHHRNMGALVTLAVKERNTSRDLLFDGNGSLAGWKHNESGEVKEVKGKKASRGYGFSGIHVINTSLFSKINEEGAFSIIDLYLRLAVNEKINAFDHTGGGWIEFGRTENIKNAKDSKEFVELVQKLKEKA